MRLALISSKGGAGKSALSIALAGEAMARGLRVLLADGDTAQGTCLLWAETAAAAGKPTPTAVGVTALMHRPDQLPRVSAGFDWTIVDTPGRLSDVQRSALAFADVALIPTSPSPTEIWGLGPALEVVREAMNLREALRAAVVLTRVQGKTALARAARQALEGIGLPVLRTTIGYRIAWQECVGHGLSITTYDRGDGALEGRRLFDEVEALRAQGATARG